MCRYLTALYRSLPPLMKKALEDIAGDARSNLTVKPQP